MSLYHVGTLRAHFLHMS